MVQHMSNGAQLEFETIHKLPVKREAPDSHVVGFSFNDNKRQAGKLRVIKDELII